MAFEEGAEIRVEELADGAEARKVAFGEKDRGKVNMVAFRDAERALRVRRQDHDAIIGAKLEHGARHAAITARIRQFKRQMLAFDRSLELFQTRWRKNDLVAQQLAAQLDAQRRPPRRRHVYVRRGTAVSRMQTAN